MNDRTCIVTREAREPEQMLRFVVGPDGVVVPDLKRKLPGRGCWIGCERALVEKAVSRNLFAKVLKAPATPSVTPVANLTDLVDSLMVSASLGALGLARKAGAVALGAAKVEATVRSGNAVAVLHATDASPDGVRKILSARYAVAHLGGPNTPAFKLFSTDELSLALGATNVIHAALLDRGPGSAALKRISMLAAYRGVNPDILASAAVEAAEDVE